MTNKPVSISKIDEELNKIHDYKLFVSLFDINENKTNTPFLENLYKQHKKESFDIDVIMKWLVKRWDKKIDYQTNVLSESTTKTFLNKINLLINIIELFEYIHRNTDKTGIEKKIEILNSKLNSQEMLGLITGLRNYPNMYKTAYTILFKDIYIYFLGNLRVKYFITTASLNNFYNECENYVKYNDKKITIYDFIGKSMTSLFGEYRLYTIFDVYSKTFNKLDDSYKLTFINDGDYILGKKEILTSKDDKFKEMNLKYVMFTSLYTKSVENSGDEDVKNDMLKILKELLEIEKQVNTAYVNKHEKLLENMKFNVDFKTLDIDKLDLSYFDSLPPEYGQNDVLIKLRLLRTSNDTELETFKELLDMPVT